MKAYMNLMELIDWGVAIIEPCPVLVNDFCACEKRRALLENFRRWVEF
ncbi:hypothetical protein SBDP1_120010 [Syntrophobacter sp. SbD1]|nr:hypothetical protein SBDP1_120010 [Syntrophobacter sp. SbD1]